MTLQTHWCQSGGPPILLVSLGFECFVLFIILDPFWKGDMRPPSPALLSCMLFFYSSLFCFFFIVFLGFSWEKLNRGVSKPGCFPLFSGKVQIVLRTLSGLFLVGALHRLSKRERTNRENPRTIPAQIGKVRKRTKKEGQVQIGKPPRLAALENFFPGKEGNSWLSCSIAVFWLSKPEQHGKTRGLGTATSQQKDNSSLFCFPLWTEKIHY